METIHPNEFELPFNRITLVGAGLIGGAFLSLLREQFSPEALPVHVVDTREETLQLALKTKLANTVSPTLPQSFEGRHLILLATHLNSNEQYLREIARCITPENRETLVVDMGSCKRRIVALGHELLPHNFIAGHPMAGREKQGLEHAAPLLFFQRRFLLTPHPDFENMALLEGVESLLTQMGMRPVRMTAETHDNYMAYVSHLPQLYAVVLTNLLARHRPWELLQFQGGGIDDQLRLAASPAEMWAPIYAQNADNMRHVLDEMIGVLQEMREGLEDEAHMAEWFATSNTIHRAYEQIKRKLTSPDASADAKRLL